MIIKCPECGNAVSTMAGTCPKCGVKIAGNLVKCPKCGRISLRGASQCSLCKTQFVTTPVSQETAVSANPTTSANTTQPTPPSSSIPPTSSASQPVTPLPPVHKRRGCCGIITVSGIVLVAAVILGAFFLWTSHEHKMKEQADYERLKGVTNPEFFSQFLSDYPESDHAPEVKEWLNRAQAETEEWAQVLKDKSRIRLTNFLQSYPTSAHERECRYMIDSIDWREAASLDTEQALEAYMKAHPSGRYCEEATVKLNELTKLKITDSDRMQIRGMLDGFFTGGMARGDLETIALAIPGKMDNFCGTANATPEQIAQFTAKKKASDVMGIHYLINADMTVKRADLSGGEQGYDVSFSLDETVNRSDATQPSTKTYQVETTLNSSRKIVRMSIK